jgi:hypothetical protein
VGLRYTAPVSLTDWLAAVSAPVSLAGTQAGISEYERKLQREDAVRQKAEEGAPSACLPAAAERSASCSPAPARGDALRSTTGSVCVPDLIAMEREEAELIARLKKAQEAQANAFSELEHALMTEVRVSPKRATKTASVLSPR